MGNDRRINHRPPQNVRKLSHMHAQWLQILNNHQKFIVFFDIIKKFDLKKSIICSLSIMDICFIHLIVYVIQRC